MTIVCVLQKQFVMGINLDEAMTVVGAIGGDRKFAPCVTFFVKWRC